MDKIWLKRYPKGMPETIDPEHYNSLLELFDESFTQYASLPAYSNMSKTMTYQQIDIATKAVASYLQNTLGLGRGDKVAVMMPNLLQTPISILGVLRAGCLSGNNSQSKLPLSTIIPPIDVP